MIESVFMVVFVIVPAVIWVILVVLECINDWFGWPYRGWGD